jgi:aryl-alcohol dehydrogenase-like predicted oxidoreductase
MLKRRLGRSNIEVSALGMGCWTIGGPWYFIDHEAGWGQVDDDESIRAIHCALDMGITFFDTAAVYGCGHSEQVLGQALVGQREQVVIASKFGYAIDEKHRFAKHHDDVVGNIRDECEASLLRLNTDHIDLYQFHIGRYDPQKAGEVLEVLEKLVAEGKIRWYGWSTDNPEGARIFAQGVHCTAIQHLMNIANDSPAILAVCEEFDLASINRVPLGGGLLTGKYTLDSEFTKDDIRSTWNLNISRYAERLKHIETLRELLTQDGRTLAQAALAWLWGRSQRTIPIPGFRNEAQVQENVKALDYPPLSADQMQRIEELFGRK